MSGSGQGPEGPSPPSPLRYVGLGFELAAPLLIGVFVGYRVDIWLDTTPWFLLGGAILGMAAGFASFFRAVLPRGRDRDGGGE